LKNLRAQLYSAAEYFELSYTNDDQKQMWVALLELVHIYDDAAISLVSSLYCWFLFLFYVGRVVETLKDYAIKALVNTVDHLGSVTYKVNDLLDEKVVEVSVAELRVSCIEQVYLMISISLQMEKVH